MKWVIIIKYRYADWKYQNMLAVLKMLHMQQVFYNKYLEFF